MVNSPGAIDANRRLCAQVRTLETIIRLSTAAAKVRLSASVEEQDVDIARALVCNILNSDKAGGCAPHDDLSLCWTADNQQFGALASSKLRIMLVSLS